MLSRERLCLLLKQHGVSQGKLASELEVSIRTVNRWVTGETKISRVAELAIYYITESWKDY